MLGILIGITAVVLTVGIGQGARAQVQDDINALGTNLLVISPGSSTSTAGSPRWIRIGVDAHRAGRRHPAIQRRRARHRSRRTGVDDVGIAGERHDQLDHDPHRHHTAWDYVRTREYQFGSVHQRAGRDPGQGRGGARIRHRERAVRWRSIRSDETVSYNGMPLEVDRCARRR